MPQPQYISDELMNQDWEPVTSPKFVAQPDDDPEDNWVSIPRSEWISKKGDQASSDQAMQGPTQRKSAVRGKINREGVSTATERTFLALSC